MEITREVARLSEQAQRRFGIEISVRVGVHRGLVYLDTAQDDVYGLAANLAARVSGLAPPGTVVVSDAVEPLVRDAFELEARPPAAVKGVDGLIAHHQVVGERPSRPGWAAVRWWAATASWRGCEKSWARAQAGTLTTPGVVFRGEPGIGKCRLAAAAAELAEALRRGGAGVGRVAVSHRRRPASGAHAAGAPLRHRPRSPIRLSGCGCCDAEVAARGRWIR